MRLTMLGTGSPGAHARKASSGYLIETGADRILLDCGGGVYDRLLQSGRRPSDVTHLFFTHLHSDHMMDYARLVHGAWDEEASPLTVVGPAPIRAIHAKLFGEDGAFAHDLRARTLHPGSQEIWAARGGTVPRPWPAPDITEIAPGFRHEGDGWTVTSCEVPHAQPFLTCMGLRVDAGGASVVYAGDSGRSADLERLAAGADVLIHWCYRRACETEHAHIVPLAPAPFEIGAAAARAGVGRLILTHLRAHMDTEEIRDELLSEARAGFGGDVSIAEDLAVLEL